MKEFNQMTLKELLDYEGPIFSATITEQYPSTGRVGWSDVSSPSREMLLAKIKGWSRPVLAVGNIKEHHHKAGGFLSKPGAKDEKSRSKTIRS